MDDPEEPLYFPSSESGSESDRPDDIKDCLEEKTVASSGISSDTEGVFLIQTDRYFHYLSFI
jgi:hypothetical protein